VCVCLYIYRASQTQNSSSPGGTSKDQDHEHEGRQVHIEPARKHSKGQKQFNMQDWVHNKATTSQDTQVITSMNITQDRKVHQVG